MKILPLSSELSSCMKNFQIPPQLGFGDVIAPLMISCDYGKGSWGDLSLLPYGPLSIHPTCKVFHYSQEIFEGMKAYYVEKKGPFLFRPDCNFHRFNASAERMGMPSLPMDLFMSAVRTMTTHCVPFIPQKKEHSLYIRPFMIATENNLGIKPSEEFKFMVVASPSGSYFSGKSISAMVERKMTRAAPGGVGMAKTGGNYGAGIASALKAQKAGFMQPLWLDSQEKKYIEEFSGMNFFCVIKGRLHTPPISETILNGITRDSLVKMASHKKIEVIEEKIPVDSLLSWVKEKTCTEIFACGTATIITPVNRIGDEGEDSFYLDPSPGPIATDLRTSLLNLQEGRDKDIFGWVQTV